MGYCAWRVYFNTSMGGEMLGVKVKLLVVDDEIAIRTSLSHIFADLQYAVRTAEDGLSALLDIENVVPDVLLSDLNMPIMSGFDLLVEVRRRFPAIRVIAMSGAFSGVEIPNGVAADAFYEKGTSIASLLGIMTTIIMRSPREAVPLRLRYSREGLRANLESTESKHAVLTDHERMKLVPTQHLCRARS